jgi:hypothetical protein
MNGPTTPLQNATRTNLGSENGKKVNTKPKAKAWGNNTNAKTWSSEPNDTQRKFDKDFNTFVKKQIKQVIQKELNTTALKKCKSDDNDLTMLDIALQNFKCEDMNSTTIDTNLGISEGEISNEMPTWKIGQDEANNADELTLMHTECVSNGTDVSLIQFVAHAEWPELFAPPDIMTQCDSLDNCPNDSLELQSMASLIQGHPSGKKTKSVHLKPIAFVRLNTRHGESKLITVGALLNSGAAGSLATDHLVT